MNTGGAQPFCTCVVRVRLTQCPALVGIPAVFLRDSLPWACHGIGRRQTREKSLVPSCVSNWGEGGGHFIRLHLESNWTVLQLQKELPHPPEEEFRGATGKLPSGRAILYSYLFTCGWIIWSCPGQNSDSRSERPVLKPRSGCHTRCRPHPSPSPYAVWVKSWCNESGSR